MWSINNKENVENKRAIGYRKKINLRFRSYPDKNSGDNNALSVYPRASYDQRTSNMNYRLGIRNA